MFGKFKQLEFALRVAWHETADSHTRIVNLNDRKLQLMEGGQGEPLLYLHSACGENLWLPFHQRLARRYRVIAPAHPGCAASEGLADIDSMEDLIFHYLEVLDYLTPQPVNIVGVSLGGWIAAELAVRYPERVKRMVLAAPVGLWLDAHPMTDIFSLIRHPEKLRPILLHDPASYLARLLLPAEPPAAFLLEPYKALTLAARLGWSTSFHNPKLAGRLRRVKSPVLILWGDDDRLIPSAYAAEWARHLPDGRVVLLPHCGHLLMFEAEEGFVQSISDFLG